MLRNDGLGDDAPEGGDWLASRMVATGFEVPSLATRAYVAEAVKLGLLESAEAYDRFWRETAEELVRNARGGPDANYRSPYLEEIASGQDRVTFNGLNLGLFDAVSLFPGETGRSFHARRLDLIREQKAVEGSKLDGQLVRAINKGPAAALKVLAKTLPLSFARGRELGLPFDGPCLVGNCSERLRPILFFEPGRRMARVDLSAHILLLREGQIIQGFSADKLVRGIGWYQQIASQEEEALGLAAYARFVVELAAGLNDGKGTGETP